MRRIAIATLGCKTNQFESAAMAETLERDGFFVVPFEEHADIYVINTCTVTSRTDTESRRLIRRACKRQPNAKIVVTGCYAQVAFEALRGIDGVHLVLGNAEKKNIAEFLKETGESRRELVSDIFLERQAAGFKLENFTEHTRAFLQIQNGCDAFCSYCIVPYARGKSRSVLPEEVLTGIKLFAEKGFKEVVLTGIHIGAYGLDLSPPRDLLGLLTLIEKERPVRRLRIGSIEPTEITTPMVRFLAASEMVCPHLHIPLQSGDDSVLLRMNRHYTISGFRKIIEEVTASIPDISLGCDVIAGFPGESDEAFENSYKFIEALPITYLHVFPFSSRPGTPAATMTGKVPAGVVHKRASALRQLSERKKRGYHEKFIGKSLKVLVQEEYGEGMMKGLSDNYISVLIPGDDSMVNDEIKVRITGSGKGILKGEPV